MPIFNHRLHDGKQISHHRYRLHHSALSSYLTALVQNTLHGLPVLVYAALLLHWSTADTILEPSNFLVSQPHKMPHFFNFWKWLNFRVQQARTYIAPTAKKKSTCTLSRTFTWTCDCMMITRPLVFTQTSLTENISKVSQTKHLPGGSWYAPVQYVAAFCPITTYLLYSRV